MGSSASAVVFEVVRLLQLLRQATPELARAAAVCLSGQWAFLVLACAALLSMVLLLSWRNEQTPSEFIISYIAIGQHYDNFILQA